MFIKDMLKEELLNSIQIRKDFKRAVNDLPKGALVCKVISGHEYCYLALRNGEKVQFKYLGKLSKEEVAKHEEAKKYRAKYRKQISEVDQQIKFIRKALRG